MKSFLETLSHNFRIKAIIGFLLCAPAGNIAQSGLYPNADSLQNKGYDYLQQSFFKNRKDKARSENYAQLWLARAKAEQNHEQQSLAFKALAYTANNEKIAYVYLDSMVAAARQSGSDAVLGAAYLTKGISLYEDFEHQKALDNYLLADACLSRTADQYQKAKVKYQIAQTKYQLGFYHEAIALLTSTAAYFESENDRAYLNALYALSLCYNSIGNYQSSEQVVHIGQKAAREWGLDDLLPYFSLSEAMNLYGQKHYTQAAQKLNGILPVFAAGNDKANLALSSFFIAKCYWQLGKATQALPHLKKIDEIFNEKKYIRPDLLQGYEMLIDHYKSTGNTKLALHYMGRLLAAGKVVDRDYKYLSDKVLRKYNTRELQQQIQETLNQSHDQKIYGSILIALLCAALAAVIYRHQRQRKEYSEKFKEWVKKKKQLASKDVPVPVGYSESQLGFSEELAERLVKRLELFEKRHEYIEPYMNLQKLAAKLNTNQKYVTRLLAHYRGKGTIEYISDLKIEYIVQKLQSEKKLRNYKNKSLSDEVGFGSTQIFTRTFKAKVGMPPTVFIDELNKADQMS